MLDGFPTSGRWSIGCGLDGYSTLVWASLTAAVFLLQGCDLNGFALFNDSSESNAESAELIKAMSAGYNMLRCIKFLRLPLVFERNINEGGST